MERERLERLYLDCLRKQFPTTEQFQQATTDYLASQEYEVADQTRAWPRDVRVCVMKELSCTDISRLARTCKHWAATITSQSYDVFWRARYVHDYPEYPPSDPVPRALPNTAIQIGWFDLYQYVYARRTLARKQFSARTLRAFLMRKYSVEFFCDKFSDVNFMWDREFQYELISLDWLPESFRESDFLKKKLFALCGGGGITIMSIAQAVVCNMGDFPPISSIIDATPFKEFSRKSKNPLSAMSQYLAMICSPIIAKRRWANVQIV